MKLSHWNRPQSTGPKRPKLATGPNGKKVRVGLIKRLLNYFSHEVWLVNTDAMHPLQGAMYRIMRVGSLTIRGFLRDRCLFRAQALTFITVLSIVPLLAFTFSVAKGLGAYSRMQLEIIGPFLDNNIGLPADTGAGDGKEVASVGLRETLDKLLFLVEGTDFGKIGLFGLAVLLYIIIKLLSAIEASFNDIWGVERPTVILITHDVREAVLLSDRIYVFSDRPGQIVAEFEVPLERPRTIEMLAGPQATQLELDLLRALHVGSGDTP